MGNKESHAAEAGSAQPGLDDVLPDSPEWASVSALWFESGAHTKTESLNIRKIWRVRKTPLFQQYEAVSKTMGRPKQLFHGTSLSSAQRIARDGFKLPSHAGLYGKGLYFANNPHKSASYAPEASWMPFFRRWHAGGVLSAIITKDEGQMLVCDVYLGSSKTVCCGSWGDIDPSRDLKGGWIRQICCMGEYHSLYAFGLLGHTEYIVYKESQVVPRYLIEFQYDRK